MQVTADPLFLSFQLAVAGQYSIDRELGRGGMGVVYLAREVHLDRLVAIKLLPPHLAERAELREGFVREARNAAKLSHPNIIPIHAVSETDGFVYCVMAYVAGETLAQRVQSRGPLSASEATRILREVAWALSHAHGHALVHRDVKPDNILIESETGRVLVADFGIAAAIGHSTTLDREESIGSNDGVTGTPGFMSPEQALGGRCDIDERTDLYSLGATGYFALTGRLPFEGVTPTEILARQLAGGAPDPISATGAAVSSTLSRLIHRCLASDVALRPPSAAAFADGLSEAMEQRRELPAALRAFVKRNGRMDGAGTMLTLMGTLVSSVSVSAFAGPAAGVATLIAGCAVAPLVFCVTAARRIAKLGFVQADLVPAFRAERENSREERSLDRSKSRMLVESALGAIARVSGSTSIMLLALALAGIDNPRFKSIGFIALVGLGIASV